MYFVLVVFRGGSPYWLKEACVHIGDSLSLSKTIHRTVWFMKIFHLPLTCFWELQFDGGTVGYRRAKFLIGRNQEDPCPHLQCRYWGGLTLSDEVLGKGR